MAAISDSQLHDNPATSLWAQCRTAVLLTIVGGAIDTIGFIALLGFFTAHVTGNLVLAGAAFVKGGAGLWVKLGAIPLFIVTVMLAKMWIDRCSQSHKTLGWLFVAEAVFLSGFMLAGLYFDPLLDPGAGELALTGGLGLMALAIRNTASKTLIKHISPSTMMTGNTTQLGIDLSNFVRTLSREHGMAVLKSGSIVAGFVAGAFLGAVLYMRIGFWSVLPFMMVTLYLASLSFRKQFI
ncbi:YoaK family protein [Cupriavidus sp. WKF15]|uniref:YoaK family protein n=1 Tax=Cupriavidus sp. WKF15 TaxID=3032282 RepID=UPI0023E16396|nr:YoaK family protein [Cupriavidus sp. WKF15]WER47499.1 YoaK family protein [Cupriavidus sp. WKF15]